MLYPSAGFLLGGFLVLTGCASLEKWGEKSSATSEKRVLLGMEGCNFSYAREFTGKYCVDCHSTLGTHAKRGKALKNLKMDTYKDWKDAAGAVPSVLDLGALEAPVMPPTTHAHQPSAEERRMIVEWVKRGSPNTDSGR